MDISINEESGARVVHISGRVDSSTSPQLDQALKECFAGDSQSPLVLDFAEVSFLSSAGLRILLLAAKAARQQHLNLAICSLIPPIQEIFEMSGFMGIMDVHADRQQALTALAGSKSS
ncbi:anti-sigma B factor antagonist/stage II sporulation protein AA (anti-sigma F factor antagonist) [Ectothiorhodosinus mongolicus]|uniref:Anti-sigma factor antagonist n=1 Tax=Ectothiorhodosinus mongolicus TaxID=233100 RepID=A0A1R3W626_9GAMM|nr:STAS domain-containing protein [Ectothiorhodosinus mongolicus]ULX57645.1 anti-sigma factor antagonist [Ectothiorhodosinus mongolicus]SIT73266.1 anti-sigma B factor antagonist/stage II sporulation protein AA (anti-sigma F factor antagonist) [Ectothiorhodosinus mongolicus]